MPILNYIFTMFGKHKPRIEVIRRESTSIRVEEWRSHPELVAMAEAVWRNPDFRLMMQVVDNDHPGRHAVLSGGLEAHAMYQTRTEGYHLALAKLKSLQVPIEARIDDLETEYAPEEPL